MKRLHVHLSVDSLADSVRFYSSMFAVEPTVLKDDYAKWMLEDPRVNFAISQRGGAHGLNHLGIQVESDTELQQMQCRLQALQPDVEKEEGVACCYARSDKYWVTDPQGVAWETFHTLDSVPVWGESATGRKADDAVCCAPSISAPLMPMKRGAAPAASNNASGGCC